MNVGLTLSSRERGIAIVDLSCPGTPREITYADLDATCDAVARGLVARGLKRSDRVGILALNRAEYIAALYGTMRTGAIPVPLNIKLPAETLARLDHLLVIESEATQSVFDQLKSEPSAPGVKNLQHELTKLQVLRGLGVPAVAFAGVPEKALQLLKGREKLSV